jgi:hypothetical protein
VQARVWSAYCSRLLALIAGRQLRRKPNSERFWFLASDAFRRCDNGIAAAAEVSY